MFEKKGYIVVEKAKADEETLLSAALDAGADDMRDDGDSWEVLSAPDAFEAVRTPSRRSASSRSAPRSRCCRRTTSSSRARPRSRC